MLGSRRSDVEKRTLFRLMLLNGKFITVGIDIFVHQRDQTIIDTSDNHVVELETFDAVARVIHNQV